MSRRRAASSGGELDQLRLRVAAGAPVSDADTDRLPAEVATVVRVASHVGAPLLDALDAAGSADDDRRRAVRAVEVASAQGRAVANALGAAPFVLVPLLGPAFGVDLVAYHRTPVGVATGTLGVILVVLGTVLARRAVARVGRPPRSGRGGGARARLVIAVAVVVTAGTVVGPIAGVVAAGGAVWWLRRPPPPPVVDPAVADVAELVAVAVAGGASPAAALRTAACEVDHLARDLRRLAASLDLGHAPDGAAPGVDRLGDTLVTADALGAPVGPTVRRLAADLRAEELSRVLAQAERLPVQLAVPTTLLLLPGLLVLAGAPVLVTGLAEIAA